MFKGLAKEPPVRPRRWLRLMSRALAPPDFFFRQHGFALPLKEDFEASASLIQLVISGWTRISSGIDMTNFTRKARCAPLTDRCNTNLSGGLRRQ